MSGSHSISIPIKYILTSDSTSTSTGAIIISGGISIFKKIRTNDAVIIHNNENDTIKSILTTGTNGSLLLNGDPISGTFDPTAVLNLTNTSESTSISTGALTVAGGIGIYKNTNIGGYLNIINTNNSSSTTTGALRVAGGAGIGSLYISGTSTHGGATVFGGSLTMGTNDIVSVGTITSSENIITTSTETSSSTTTGALRVAGGAGIGSLYVAGTSTLGGATVFGGSLTMGTNDIISVGTITSSENIITTLTTNSTTTITGALQIAGGVGIGKNLHIGGLIHIYDTTQSTTATTGALLVDGGLGITKDSYFAANVTIAQTLTAQSLVYEYEEVIQSTAESTSITTGSVIINGGVGIIKRTNIGGILTIYDTTQSTSSTTGSVIISGGIGIAKDLIVGGDISSGSVSASKSFTGPCTLTDTLNCYKIGHIVIVKFPIKTNTVTVATYFSSTGAIPNGFRPTETFRQLIFVTDNNVEIVGSITITTGGDIRIYTGSTGNFTLSGTAGFSLNIFYSV